MSLFKIECYDENEFKIKHAIIFNRFKLLMDFYGINLSKYYFAQYLADDINGKQNDDICYQHNEDENVRIVVVYFDGKLETFSLDMD